MSYDFVPLPPRVHRAERTHAQHDRLERRAVLAITFRAEEPVHVGSGHLTLSDRELVRQGARVGAAPGIPASSMKGVLRSRLEAASKSCCRFGSTKEVTLKGAISSRSYGGYKVEYSAAAKRTPALVVCRQRDLCLACALFGNAGLQGRVRLRDFSSASTSFERVRIAVRYSPRPHHLGAYEKVEEESKLVMQQLYGRKFYRARGPVEPNTSTEWAEAIGRGSEVRGSMLVMNPTDAELGALLAALGSNPPSSIRVGSAKGSGLGLMRLTALQVEIASLQGKAPASAEQQAQWRNAFSSSEDYWSDGEAKLLAIANDLPGSVAP
jgi:CRISPR/Cas system CSM-associated protein Csm3 (group 7 of RAMP superfamily)